ncbi:MAG: IS110 family transposase [Alphaproteobacteria bacterium]|jgi:transposase|nr:transposase [Acetobacteraceae bacterium]
MTETNIGIDISKDHLDVHRLPGDERRRFDNSKAGHKALIRWIGETPARVVYEPTGYYHRALERALVAAGMPIAKVNPRQARRFAEATGNLAKTDALDAAMLTRMGAVLSLEARSVPSGIINDLRDLRTARNALIKDQVAAQTRAKAITLPLLKRQNVARLKQIEAQREAVDAEINALIQGNSDLAQRFAILCSIPGIAEVSAAMLLIEMPELGSLNEKQVAALAGLAPIARQSGNWKGKSFIRGGRQQVRQGLYMPALVAIRFNADLKAKYEQLIKAGKAPKKAITAVMRKLIILANALLKKGRQWQTRVA